MSDIYFHDISPAPKCPKCTHTMANRGNLDIHCLGFECQNCYKRICIQIKIEYDWPEPDQKTIDEIDSTP